MCRCTGYKQIIDAVMAAAKVMRGEAAIEDVSVKTPEDGEYCGKPLVRPTAPGKVCGLYGYGVDHGAYSWGGDDMYERLADIKEHPVTFGGDSFYAPLDGKDAAKPF